MPWPAACRRGNGRAYAVRNERTIFPLVIAKQGIGPKVGGNQPISPRNRINRVRVGETAGLTLSGTREPSFRWL